MTDSDRGRRPVARAFRIQEVLVASAVPLGISALSRLSALPKSTVARIMVSLTEADIARRVGAGYVAGPRLLSMAQGGAGAGVADHLRRWLLPYIVQLHDLTGLAAAFGTLHHGQVHFSNVCYGRTGTEKLAGLSLWAPAERTAAGKLLLAHSSANGTANGLAVPADYGPVGQAAFSRELWRIRREGVAYHHGEYVPGILGMATGLYDRAQGLVGAIALCGPMDGFSAVDARTALRHVAGTASMDLRRSGNSLAQG